MYIQVWMIFGNKLQSRCAGLTRRFGVRIFVTIEIVSYAWSQVTMKVSRYSFLIFIASQLFAACNSSDIKCINAFREKGKLYFGRNTKNWADYFSRCVNHSIDVEFGRRSFQFAILRSRDFCRHSNLKVQSLAHKNAIPLFYKKILARIMLVLT